MNKHAMHRWIFPVIHAVPAEERALPPPERVRVLSRQARDALGVCAQKAGIVLGALEKDDHGAPLPFEGHYWSLTHKPTYVGAVLCPQATGIDIETVREVSAGLIRIVAQEKEWRLSDEDPTRLFFRYWTAKEAVLKAAGVGIAGLEQCRVTAVPDKDHLRLEYMDASYLVEHFFFDGHVATVVKNRFQVEWILRPR
jgi:4'-phosphopantetheinyl transferase